MTRECEAVVIKSHLVAMNTMAFFRSASLVPTMFPLRPSTITTSSGVHGCAEQRRLPLVYK
jgi:hypothetical protein